MTALTEEELDVIFEHYTQLKALPNFDAYFAENKTVAEDQRHRPPPRRWKRRKPPRLRSRPRLPQKWKSPSRPQKRKQSPPPAEAPVKPAQNASGQPVPNQPKRKAVMPGKITPVAPSLRIKASLSRKQLKSSRSLRPARSQAASGRRAFSKYREFQPRGSASGQNHRYAVR